MTLKKNLIKIGWQRRDKSITGVSKSRRDGITIAFLIDKHPDLNSEGVALDGYCNGSMISNVTPSELDEYLRRFVSIVMPSLRD
jgi:hypothetical protein